MADSNRFGWQGKRSVEDWLMAEGYRFDFYQAVRLLELLDRSSVPVAEGPDARKETVRFHSRVSFEFPASEVQEITPSTGPGEPAAMTVNFLGLAGALGPLPTSFTELLLDRVRSRDTGMRDFLDIFNHRLVSLMYRIRKVHRLQLNNDAPEDTHIAGYLRSFLGIGLPSLEKMLDDDAGGIHSRELLGYAGLLSRRPISASVLQQVLAHHFRIPVRIRQLVGAWRPLAVDQHTRIGFRLGQNQRLGSDALLGTRIWDQQGRFRIEIGPTSLARVQEFLPNGHSARPLARITRFYVGNSLDFTVRLRLKADEVPETRLGTARLGWTSWLKTKPLASEGIIELTPPPATH